MHQRITELEASETQRKRAEEAQDKEPNCLRILAVDDDQTALYFYREVLYPMGNLRGSETTTGDLETKLSSNRFSKTSIPSFDVIPCHRGDEAVETVRVAIEENKPFAVVFLDVRLPPGPDGVWTAEHIRALDPYLQIVMVTGYSDVDPVGIACRVPPMEKLFYIRKPLDPQEVRQFASALGAKWHAERQVRKIHAELRESEEKYRTLTESSLTGVFIHQDGKYVFVNDRFAEIHGYRTQELLGKKYWTLIHPDEREATKEKASKRLKGEAAPQRYEVRRLRKDRETIWCEMMAACIEYRGKPAIMGNIIDITARKQAEETLRESEKRYTVLFESTPDGILAADIHTRKFQYANPAICSMLGYSKEELMGISVDDIHPKEHIERVLSEFKHMARGEKTLATEIPCLRKDGTVIYADINTTKELLDGKETIIGFFRDITERKRAEEALQESEQKYKSLINNVKLGIFRSTPGATGKFLEVNPTMEEITGYSREELLSMNVSDLYVRPEEREAVLEEMATAVGKATKELNFRKKDGTEIVVSDTKVAVRDNTGKVLYFDGIIEDITERKQAEGALQESEKKLRFLSSHLLTAQERERRRVSIELHDELGQALTLLKIRLRFIERKLRKDQAGIRQDCEDTLGYMDQVIENVRRLSRDLSPSILDDLGLSAALRWLIDDFTKHYNIKTSLYMDDINDLFSLEAQITIYRIFQESFTNIVKHAQATRVSVAIRKQNGSVSFLVEDDGKGFDVEQAVGRNSTEKGLGLTAMDERARMLEGFLDIWSQEEKGTRITLTIPMDERGGR